MSSAEDHTVSTAEALINKLYGGTAQPEEVVQIQERLQQLQTSESGWLLAQQLLDNPDQNARFFAALTFAIKINQDAVNFSADAAIELQSTLLSGFVRRVDSGDSRVVLRKICSSLVAFFVQPSSDWPRPILHVVRCLQNHGATPPPLIGGTGLSDDDLASLSPGALSAVLAFTTILAEDAGRVPHSSEFHSCHETLGNNVTDSVALMKHVFQKCSADSSEYQSEVLQCYQSWIAYVRESFSVASEQMISLHELFSPLMSFLVRDDTFEATAEFFVDMFSYDQSFVTKPDLSSFAMLLQSEWCVQQLASLQAEDADELNFLFGQLVLAFGSAAAKPLIRSHVEFAPIMDIMHAITRSQTHATIDQTLANQICDFWDDYTMSAPDEESETPEDLAAFTAAKKHWLQAINELTAAASLPLDQLDESKTSSAEDSLSEFRSRVRSTIQASYDEFGVSVLQSLIDLALEVGVGVQGPGASSNGSDHVPSQAQLEVILYCLGDLSTSMEYHPGEEDLESRLLERFFTSSMFASLVQPTSHVAIALRKRAINIMSDQDDYFRNHGQYLLDALDMLFSSLQQSSLSESAARAIRNLSDSGRKLLVPRVADFCTAARLALQSTNLTTAAKEDVLAASGFVVQAVASREDQLPMIQALVSMVIDSIDQQLQLGTVADAAEARKEGFLEALKQLNVLAKAVQSPGIRIISLDDDDVTQTGIDSIIDGMNERLASAIAALLEPRDDGQLLEAACRILRVGYKETPPTYFAFKPSVTAGLVTSVPHTNPRLDYAVDTAAAFLSSQQASTDESQESKLRLIDFVARMMENIGAPSTDPELAHACVEFVSRLVPIHTQTLSLVPPQYTRLLFAFTLQCLGGADVLPKKSAANLWAAVAGMSGQANDFFHQLVSELGPALTTCLVFNFGGNAARSEIDGLARVYRRLLTKHPHTKQWTEAALWSSDFPSSRPTDADKRRWVAQLMLCRDEKTTDRVAREFWTLCRGTPTGYG